jgi:hypothetical protein
MGLFSGSSPKVKKHQVYTGGQMQFLNQLLGMLGGSQGGQGGNFLDYYSNLLGGESGQGDLESFAEPYRQQFENETIPMLAERFAGAGGGMGGALSSSGFGQSLGSAGGNFNAQLAQLFASLRQNAAGQMSGLAGLGLGAQPYALTTTPGSPGAGMGLLGGALGSFLGPMGTAAGSALGNFLGSRG